MANIGCPQGPPVIIASTQSESAQVLAHLQSRVAVLEVELSHVTNEKNASRVVNQYLLDSLASNLQAPNTTVPASHPDISDLRAQLAKSEQETNKLQIHLDLLKDDYAKLRLKFKRVQAIRRTSRQWSGTRHEAVVAECALGQGTVNTSPRCATSEDTSDLLDTDALENLEAASSKRDLLVPTYPDVTVTGKPAKEFVTSEDIFAAPPPRYLPHFKAVNMGSKPRSLNSDESDVQLDAEVDVQLPTLTQLIPLVEKGDCNISSTVLPNLVVQRRADGLPEWASMWATSRPSPGACFRPRAVEPTTGSSTFNGDPFNSINHGVAGNDRLPETHFSCRGIAYCPPKESVNVHRTVIIENLPFETTVADIANKVRGGLVVSIQILDTSKIVNSRTAMVIFFHGQAATNYVDFSSRNQILVGDRKVVITLLTSPTWPMSLDFIAGVRDYKHTRCLVVYQFPRHISDNALKNALCLAECQNSHGIVTIDEINQGSVHVSFYSIEAAHSAFKYLGTSDIFQGCRVFFAPDPCAERVEALLKPVQSPHRAIQPSSVDDDFGAQTTSNALPYEDSTEDNSTHYIGPRRVSSSTARTPARRPFHNDRDRPHNPPVATDLDYGSTSEKSLFDDGYKVVDDRLRSKNSKMEPKTSGTPPRIERDGRISEKISSVPFQPEKPPSVDPVESGDLITWVDEDQYGQTDG